MGPDVVRADQCGARRVGEGVRGDARIPVRPERRKADHGRVLQGDGCSRGPDAIPSDLATLYWVISELSLPDVDSGYFVHSPATVAEHFREYGSIGIAEDGLALVFASDGAAPSHCARPPPSADAQSSWRRRPPRSANRRMRTPLPPTISIRPRPSGWVWPETPTGPWGFWWTRRGV